MLHYILQTIAFQLFFLIIYDVFLKKETFFNYNRAYLLVTALLSIILPFIKLQSFKTIVPEQFVIRLPEVIIGKTQQKASVIDTYINAPKILNENTFSWSWSYLLYIGMCIAALILMLKILKLVRLIYKNPKRWKGNVLIIKLINSNSAFSFFHYVFLGENIRKEDQTSILNHEMVHVKQKHTIDLLFFEVLKIIFWFNPLVYMYQTRISALHEFIADSRSVKVGGKTEYYQNLLSQVFETQHVSFVNTFFKQSLIKKRIVMLSKSKSKQIHLIKYALLIPTVCIMLMYTSSYAQEIKPTETAQDETIYEKLSDEALLQKFYEKLVELAKNTDNAFERFEEYMPKSDKYIHTRIEHAKFGAFMKYISTSSIKRKSEDGTLTQEDVERAEKLIAKHKTYQEYLEWKKTDEAKEQWENNIKDGVLRLVVNDFKNMTEAEQKKFEEKMKMIENDDYFHSLLVTDAKTSIRMRVQDIDNKKTPNTSKEDLVKTEDVIETIEVPFSVIENPPTFTFCETLKTNEEKRKCMSDNITSHVNENFNKDLAKSLGLKGRIRMNVIFKIGKEGEIYSVKARAPHPKLEEEAIRVIKSLPTFIPGKQKGKTVVVPYSLPILFEVNE